VIVYRICKTYPPDYNPLAPIAIGSKGASKNGGRWNSIGRPLVYTASSLALARSEMARHINMEDVPDDYRVFEIEIPDQEYIEVDQNVRVFLSRGVNSDETLLTTKKIGDDLLSDKSILAIKVPSICDPITFNYLLNPDGDDYNKVKIVNDYPFVV